VIIASDTLGSYGSMARFTTLSRVFRVNESTVMAAGGDYADYQFLKQIIEQKVLSDECIGDGFGYTPKSLHSWLTRFLYNRRSRFNPLWNTLIVAGMLNGEAYLGFVDKVGTAYEAPSVASGYGAYIAQPMLRDAIEKNPNMTEQEARDVIQRCMTVLNYRDARSWNKFEMAVVAKDHAAEIIGPVETQADWTIARDIRGYE